MITSKNLIFIILITIFFSACSTKVFLPYEEEALCNCGQGVGYCGSVSDVYNEVRKSQ